MAKLASGNANPVNANPVNANFGRADTEQRAHRHANA
jgi:hypothetical protein